LGPDDRVMAWADGLLRGFPPGASLNRVLWLDFLTYLPDNLLVKVDRGTMLASIEARAPYLDREVMELALAAPSALKVRGVTTKAPSVRQDMLAVEAAMRAYAEKHGADPETWGIVGLLHDFDYEKFPNHEHSPSDGHPAWGVGLLRDKGVPEPMCRAILGHGAYTGVPRDSLMAQTLFAVDELCGFLVACALVRPSKSFVDLEVSSVKKKLKDKGFARGVNRDEGNQGAAELGVPLDEHIAFVIRALRPAEVELGLGGQAAVG